jgi:hypothetical protein
MRSLCLGLVLLLAPAATVRAQSPRVEAFAGYSVLPADRNDDFPRRTSHGIQGSVSINVTEWFGLVVDVGFHANTNRDVGPGFEGLVARTRVTELLAGPRFVARSGRVSVFARGLAGTVRGDGGEDFSGFSDTKLGFGGGAGVDVGLSKRLAVRGQFDLIASFTDIVEGNSRSAIGLVWRLGEL